MLQRTQEPELRGELLRDMIAESDRLYRLVEDLLVLTRIERESLDIANGPIRITPIVERVAAAERAGSPSAAVEVTIARPLPIVLGEETYVEQVVRNLVGTRSSTVSPNGVVTVRVEPSDGGRRAHPGPRRWPGDRRRRGRSRLRAALPIACHGCAGIRLRDRSCS